MRFIPIVLMCAGFVLVQCRSNQAQSKKAYDSIISVKVGKPFDARLNKAKTHALIQSKDSGSAATDYRYVVIKRKTNEVLLEGKFNSGGYVKWINDNQVEVFNVPKHVTVMGDSALYKRQIFLEGAK
jgi:hypothetical protein